MGDDRLTQNVLSTIKRHKMLLPGDVLLLAISGGRDSMAMAEVFRSIRSRLQIGLAVGHVDHGLRPESPFELEFVREYCREAGMPFFHACLDGDMLHDDPGGVEHAARRERYRCLRQMADEAGADKIATGHHMDDQAETVLYRALRGAGTKGLSAIRPVSDRVIRPMLRVQREMIDEYCQKKNVRFVEDQSNADENFVRNAIRRRLLPVCRDIMPGSPAALARLAEVRRLEEDLLDEIVESDWSRYLKAVDDGWSGSVGEFLELGQGRRFLLIRKVIQRLTDAYPDLETIYRIESALESGNPSSIVEIGGGWAAKRRYETVYFEKISDEENGIASRPLPENGRIAMEGVGVIDVISSAKDRMKNLKPGPDVAWLNPDRISGGLRVRSRRDADAYTRVGAPGMKKLNHMFIDAKIPVDQRDLIPVVCDEEGIVWVPGFGPARRCAADMESPPFLALTFVKES